MAAPTGNFFGVGARYARVLVLNEHGIPAATAADGVVYEGYELATLKNFNVEWPDARKIDHYGGDRVRATDFLPPNASGSAKMALGSLDPATYAALSDTKVNTIGEASFIGMGTSKRGFETDVMLYAVQQAVNGSGLRRWMMDLAPVARAMFTNSSMNENPAEFGVSLMLAVASAFPWGIAFSEANNGFTTAEAMKGFFDNFPVIVAWLGDNVITKFLFPTAMQAYNATTKIHAVWVWDVGTETSAVDATVTKATDGVTPTAKPAAGDIVVCLYEAANAPG